MAGPVISVAIPTSDTTIIEQTVLDDRGCLKILPASAWQAFDWNALRLWMHRKGIYGIPTTELVTWFQAHIRGRKAIEVGAGNGSLGRALGITATDSFIQQQPEVALIYAIQGQPLVQYGQDVVKLDALAAIKLYQPEIVIASWLTQYSDGSRPGCMFGVQEEELLQACPNYVVFGSLSSHGQKSIRSVKHRVIQEPWMISRASIPGNNTSALLVWGN